MKILIDITPEFNKWIKNEAEFSDLLQDVLMNELGKGDLNGFINNVVTLPDIKTYDEANSVAVKYFSSDEGISSFERGCLERGCAVGVYRLLNDTENFIKET